MAKIHRSHHSPWVLVLLLVIGGLAGSAAGSMLAPVVPFFKAAPVIGLRPSTLDLHFLVLTFGLSVTLGPLTLVGLLLGYLLYRWL